MRYQKILDDENYKLYLEELEQFERERIYCKHDLTHCLDVARICYIMLLEDNRTIAKDIVYATALLHDIGRRDSYQNHCDHNEASVRIAKEILPNCGYDRAEISEITGAISMHRGSADIFRYLEPENRRQLTFADYFKIADQLSRKCFRCQAIATCKWKDHEKNNTILI